MDNKWNNLRKELIEVATWIEAVEHYGAKRISDRNSALADLFLKIILMMLPSFKEDYDDETDFYSDGNKILCRNEAELAVIANLLHTLCACFDDDKLISCGQYNETGFYYIEVNGAINN